MSNKDNPKILAFIGDGEGKTSAAIGHAIRAAGHGKYVAVLQFLKGRDSTGEYKYLCGNSMDVLQYAPTNANNIDIHLVGDKTFVFDSTPKQSHIDKAKEGISLAKKLISSGKYFLIILDEIFDAAAAGLISNIDIEELMDSVRAPIGSGPQRVIHLILTGRILPPELSSKIDLVTQMKKIKHYFDKGEKGIEGLDW